MVDEGLLDRPFLEKDGMTVRVFFLAPREPLSVTLRQDLTAARATNSVMIAMIMFGEASPDTLAFAASARIVVLKYTEMDELEGRCRSASMRNSRSIGFDFSGAVDGFEFPRTIRGWVKLLTDEGFAQGITVTVEKDGVVLGRGAPDRPRVDVTANKTFPAGFTIRCTEDIAADDFVAGKIFVTALSADGKSCRLPIWEKTIALVRNRDEAARQKAALANTAIGKLVYRQGDR